MDICKEVDLSYWKVQAFTKELNDLLPGVIPQNNHHLVINGIDFDLKLDCALAVVERRVDMKVQRMMMDDLKKCTGLKHITSWIS